MEFIGYNSVDLSFIGYNLDNIIENILSRMNLTEGQD